MRETKVNIRSTGDVTLTEPRRYQVQKVLKHCRYILNIIQKGMPAEQTIKIVFLLFYKNDGGYLYN